MIKNLLVSLFAVFLFALGAAGSWYFLQFQEKQKQLAEGEEAVASEHDESAHADTQTKPASVEHAADHAESSRGHSTPAAGHASDKTMAAPVAGRAMTPEEIVRYGFQYKKNMEILKQKNEELANRETRLQLIQKDVDQKKMEVEGMLKQIQQTATAAELVLQQAQQERQALATEKETLEQEKRTLSTEKESLQQQLQETKRNKPSEEVPPGPTPQGANQASDGADKQNVEKVAMILSGMQGEEASQILKTLANKGNLNYALEILDNIEPRNAAKILDALGDTELASQIAEAYLTLPREDKAKGQRR